MAQGKYSPTINGELANREFDEFCFNAFCRVPPTFEHSSYSEKVHFANYDSEGFDSYGYSAFDACGEYVGIGTGVDRNGLTEDQYAVMDSEEFAEYF